MIAVLADQHLRQERWCRQAASDQPLGCGRLHHFVAGPARVFRTGDAHDARLRRYPVQHLADAFADGVKRTTTTVADISADIEHYVLARQMIGERLAPRPNLGLVCCDDRTALLDAGNVAVEVFKRKRQLIVIEAFGATPELGSLQLLHDGLEAFDLTVAAVDDDGHFAHQAAQQLCVRRQIFKIETA